MILLYNKADLPPGGSVISLNIENAETKMLHTWKAEGKTGVRTPSMSYGRAFPVLVESIH